MKLNNILQMIEQAEVEWKTLEEVAILYGGLTGKSKNDFENGNVKYVTYKNIFGNLEVNCTTLESVKVSENEKQHCIQYGDVLFTGSSEISEEVGMSAAVTDHFDEPVYLNSFSFGVRFNDDIEIAPEFAKFLFRSNFMRKQIIKTASGVTRFNVSKERFKKIQIPIPPISLQKEIVNILDKLTELKATLKATLKAELSLREKQYQYYRDYLLTFGDDVEWKSLGEVCLNVSSGGTPLSSRSDYYDNGDIPWLRTQEVRFNEIYETETKITQTALENSSAKWIPENCVIIAISGATAGRSAINKIPLTTNQHCCNLQIDPNIANYKYVFYWVGKEFESIKQLGQGARSDLNSGIIKKYPIPIPPLETQGKIVAILDKFDSLTNSITEGLPKEIELREKQYQYYRDKLLNFNKKKM